jgi:hypothetical protein
MGDRDGEKVQGGRMGNTSAAAASCCCALLLPAALEFTYVHGKRGKRGRAAAAS